MSRTEWLRCKMVWIPGRTNACRCNYGQNDSKKS